MGESSFWYRPTRVVPDQRLLNGRCCCCCCYTEADDVCSTYQNTVNQNRELLIVNKFMDMNVRKKVMKKRDVDERCKACEVKISRHVDNTATKQSATINGLEINNRRYLDLDV